MWEEDASDDDSELVGQPVAWTMPGAPPIKRQPLAAKDAGSAAADSEAARREREARLFLPQVGYVGGGCSGQGVESGAAQCGACGAGQTPRR